MRTRVQGVSRSFGRWKSIGRIRGGSCLALSSLFFALPCLAFAQTGAQSGEFKISTDVVLVLLDVSVKDARGREVSGLSKDSFHVYENGVPQQITVFAKADQPVTVGLVMDDS